MKKLFIALMVMASTMTMVVSEAEAKRMGGGSSFGRQSQGVTRQAPAQSSQATKPAAAPATAAAPKPASPWRGILGGALLGLGLGALLSHLGLGGAMASMISTILMVALLALAAMFIYRMFMRRKNGPDAARPAYAGAYDGVTSKSTTPEIGSRLEPSARQGFSSSSGNTAGADNVQWVIPADFDVPGFLRTAKTYFIRMQAAWDKADINDIREFTAPEMFAELRLQIQERGAQPNNTDVVSLDAELLGIEVGGADYLASVKFTGLIKESPDASAEPFAEVWNLAKPVSGNGGWVLAGIQQLS